MSKFSGAMCSELLRSCFKIGVLYILYSGCKKAIYKAVQSEIQHEEPEIIDVEARVVNE